MRTPIERIKRLRVDHLLALMSFKTEEKEDKRKITHLGHLFAVNGPKCGFGFSLVARLLVERRAFFEWRAIQVQADRLVCLTGVLHTV